MIKILNLRIGDIVRISKHKNIFANGYVHSSIPILNENKFYEGREKIIEGLKK